MIERLKGLCRDEEGFVLMATLGIFMFLFVLCASIYAVGVTINDRIKLQNACDNAAYSAAVVQADGLSRMATVNRAMAWTYVQMTNLQMDYITYKWLKLTVNRFKEDYKSCQAYAQHLILVYDKEIGWWALLEAAISGAINIIFDIDDCATGNHKKSHEPWSCFCGITPTDRHHIKLNNLPAPLPTHSVDIIDKFIFTDNSTLESIAGAAIKLDKESIRSMNLALQAINIKMNRSMKETAENILKASLQDKRYGDSGMEDYEIYIHIPEGIDPYVRASDSKTNFTDKPLTFFSPIHSTEPDERLFLQGYRLSRADKSLPEMFPLVSIKDVLDDIGVDLDDKFGGPAYGLDQWFIRGRGFYEKNGQQLAEDHGFDAQLRNPSFADGKSGWLSDGNNAVRLIGTARNEGAFGMQRVYKDANLNEPEDGARFFGYKRRMDRGNHLIDLTALVDMGLNYFKDFLGGTSQSGGDSGGSGDSIDDLEQEIANSEAQKRDLEAKLNDPNTPEEDKPGIRSQIATIDSQLAEAYRARDEYMNGLSMPGLPTGSPSVGGTPSTGGASSSDTGGGSSALNEIGGFLGRLLDAVVDYFAGNYVDVIASCGNEHVGEFGDVAMCRKADDSRALYADYRWGSCKWFCLTKAKAYLYSIIWNGRKIWCDTCNGDSDSPKNEDHTFKTIDLGVKEIKFKSRGIGHFGFPKWFCGAGPTSPSTGSGILDRVLPLEYLPPAIPWEIEGAKHGYMDTIIDFGGFWKPFTQLTGGENSRDEYESCAIFPDGPFNFWHGKKAYPAIFRGHGRIYGDDKEIFDNRYVGARCKPWLLNDRFFKGHGTIVVAAAKKQYNPFGVFFDFMGGDKHVSDKSVLSAFDIPVGNSMWAISAARAGVRRRRRGSPADTARKYQITYDPTSDPEALKYVDNTDLVLECKDGSKNWLSEEEWKNKHHIALSHSPHLTDDISPVWDGCVCDSVNAAQFKSEWNLCEADWDATLLPVRYAWSGNSLKTQNVSEQYTKPSEENYHEIELNRERQPFAKMCAETGYSGYGTNWVWDVSTGIAILPAESGMSWKKVEPGKSYFDLSNTGKGGDFNMGSGIPKEQSTHKLEGSDLIWRNKIL